MSIFFFKLKIPPFAISCASRHCNELPKLIAKTIQNSKLSLFSYLFAYLQMKIKITKNRKFLLFLTH